MVESGTNSSVKIQPLRIQKNTPSSSPNKMNGQASHGPLSEVGLSERRRNSPSWNQTIKVRVHQRNWSQADMAECDIEADVSAGLVSL